MITLQRLRGGLLFAIVASVTILAFQRQSPRNSVWLSWTSVGHVLHMVAYAITLALCLRIRRDYCASVMRLAWSLMAGSAALAVVRHGYESLTLLNGWALTRTTSWVSLRQIPIALSLLLLAGGLVAMWSSYASVGLGLRFHLTDMLIGIWILAAVLWMWPFRTSLNDARSEYAIIRTLQSASPFLLALPALLGLVLHRVSQEMGGGQLAISLRYLVAFLILRMFGLLIGLSPVFTGFTALASTAAFHASSWLFTLAVFYRRELTLAAEDLAKRYAADPGAEIEHLIGSGMRSH